MTAPAADDLTARERPRTLIVGYEAAQAVYVAARLGLADLLADRPRTTDDLAAACAVDPSTLRRLVLPTSIADSVLEATAV